MSTFSPTSSDEQGAQGSWVTQPLAISVPPQRLPYTTRSRSAVQRDARRTGYFLAALLVVFALLNLADLASTYIGLAHGLNEGNPLMKQLLQHFGFGALIADKLLVVVAVTTGALVLRHLDQHIAHTVALVCDALILLVVVSNVVQYLAIR